MDLGGERCYPIKKSSLQSLASEQRWTFFAFAVRWDRKVYDSKDMQFWEKLASQQSVLPNIPSTSWQNIKILLYTVYQRPAWFYNQQWGVIPRKWREYFKGVLNSVTVIPSDTQEVHLGEENIIDTCSCQKAEVGKTARRDDVRFEMLKTLNRGVRWQTRACKVHRTQE